MRPAGRGAAGYARAVRQRQFSVDEAVFFPANILARVAFEAVARSSQTPDDNFVAILFSAAWVEAALNEITYDVTRIPEADLDPLLLEAKRSVIAADLFESRSASVELKLRTLCAARTQRQLSVGVQPWQNLLLLLDLRNWLVHSRPEKMSVRVGTDDEPSTIVSKEVHKLVRRLKSSGAIDRIPEGRIVPVVTAATLPGVGSWSYKTAYDSLAAVAKWHPPWRRDLLLMVHEPVQI